MLVEALRLLLVVALLIAVPGWLALKATFPRTRFGFFSSTYLVLAVGALLLMGVGSLLGFLPGGGERGWFTTLGTGFPMVELAMAGLCAGLVVVAALRGAFPRMTALAKAAPAPAVRDAPRRARPDQQE